MRRWSLQQGLVAALAVTGLLFPLWAGVDVESAIIGLRPLEETQVEGVGYPLRLIDPTGAVQLVESQPRRVVSCFLGADEILAGLGVTDRLAAITSFADREGTSQVVGAFPKALPRLGNASIENVLSLEPDLAIVAEFNRVDMVRHLVSADVPVLRLGSHRELHDIPRDIRRMGQVVGAIPEAEALIRDFEERLEAVARRLQGLPAPRVLLWAGGYVPGRETLDHAKITAAGGVNAVADLDLTGHNPLSLEIAVGLQPEVILVPDWSPDGSADVTAAITEHPLWQSTPAVRDGRVYGIPQGLLSTASHHAAHTVEYLARRFHPDAFETSPTP